MIMIKNRLLRGLFSMLSLAIILLSAPVNARAQSANLDAAKVFIDYLCSAEGQKKVADTGEFVMAPGVYAAIKGADKIMASLLLMNEAGAKQLAKLQGEFRQWFLAK